MNELLSSCYKRLNRIREYADVPLIVLIVAAVFVWLTLIGFGAHPVRMNPDTDTYRFFDFSSTHAILSSIRTFGYPALLRAIWVNTGSVDVLPAIQLACILLSVILYFFAIRKYTASSWIGLFAALPVFNTRFIAEYFDLMSSDALGCALMICTVSIAVFSVVDRRRGILFALGLSLFLTYQVRPAYLFLVILIPCIYFVLFAIKNSIVNIGKNLFGISAVCILPLIAFCLIRLFIVGQFSLVSFGGYNITGVTASLIYPKVIESLEGENRAIARDIYLRRLGRGYKSVQEMVRDNDPQIFFSWQQEYKYNIYTIAVPVVKRHAEMNQEIGSAPYVNEKLTGLARKIISLEPGYYFKWISFQIISGTKRVFLDTRQNFWLGCLLVIIFAIRVFRKGVRGAVRIQAAAHAPAIIAGGCLFSGLLLVALVEPALYRYAQPLSILIPGALLAYAFTGLTRQ
ncbi:MAG: hypothetical protein CL797_06595 [Chromatiales bacterium]|jgi:hypothetical protein|nr:hypothetical protein [Chromatiales bacterium]